VPTPKDKSPTPEIPTELKLTAEEIVVTKKTVKEVEKEKTPEAETSDKEDKVPTPKDKSPTPEIPTEIKLKGEEIVVKEKTAKEVEKEKTPEARNFR
jgi:methionine-rich copper-binding protein CopC